MKIELHLLQSFPPSNLNRDDSGMPKDCEFGGYRRARISSQCIKRSVRYSERFAERMNNRIGKRTKNSLGKLKKQLENRGIEEENADKVARVVLEEVAGELDEKDRTSVLFYTDDTELGFLAEVVNKYKDEIIELNETIENAEKEKEVKKEKKELKSIIKKISKEFFKEHANSIDSVDIALFGRMLANTPTMKIDAACQVAHAISTNKVSMEFDYFTAVDDLNPEEETGAGMIGSTAFNSACYYRYSVIDMKQLLHNLGNKAELAKQGVLGFIEGSIFAVPTGKINAFAHDAQPDFVMVVIRENDAPANLANAFEKPVSPESELSLAESSIKRLDDYWKRLNNMYGFDNDLVAVSALNQKPLDNLSSNGNYLGSVKEIISKVENYLDEHPINLEA